MSREWPLPATRRGGAALDGGGAGQVVGAAADLDGLAFPAVAELLDRLPPPFVALVHHPLALETGLTAAQAAQLAAAERRVLAAAVRVIVTSPQTRADLADYAVEPERIGIVLPGTEPAPQARGSDGNVPVLLCVASLTARKGHLVLLEALAALEDLPWRLVCVGSAERHLLAATHPGCDRGAPARRAGGDDRRAERDGARALLGSRRRVRARLASRGLRHGAGGGAGAWAGDRVDHGGRDPGDGAGGRRSACRRPMPARSRRRCAG